MALKAGQVLLSRKLSQEEGGYTVGVLVQANHGTRDEFVIKGAPVGKEIVGFEQDIKYLAPKEGDGSIIVIIATDAPVLPWQLSKLCKRVTLGLGRLGGGCQNGSGDIFLAFSTANKDAFSYDVSHIELLSDERIDPLYKATVESVEEAVLNAMVSAESMTGRNCNFVPALPHDQTIAILKKYKWI